MKDVKKTASTKRLPFIDFARGIVMILMALDHVAIYWNPGRVASEGLNGYRPKYSSFIQFLTRFVTHYCAPTFIFLAGTALALSTAKRLNRGESQFRISLRMVIRGVILLVIEFLIISPIFRIGFFYFGVLACIGVCFILFSMFRFTPTPIMFSLSFASIVLHPYLDLSWIPIRPDWGYIIHLVVHEPSFRRKPWVGLYPIIPWLGVMGLGWCFGRWVLSLKGKEELYSKSKLIAIMGTGAKITFITFRGINGFGNLLPWEKMDLMEFLITSKYPPSLVFLLWTLGGMMLMLYVGLQLQKLDLISFKPVEIILTFGKVPLFFYCAHLLLYSFIPVYLDWNKWIHSSLELTYQVWIIGLIILYPVCKAYWKLKKKYPNTILQYI